MDFHVSSVSQLHSEHRSVKRVTRLIAGFEAYDAAQNTLAGIELMPMLKKGQLVREDGAEALMPAEQFYAWPRNPQLSRPYHTLAETFRQNQLSIISPSRLAMDDGEDHTQMACR